MKICLFHGWCIPLYNILKKLISLVINDSSEMVNMVHTSQWKTDIHCFLSFSHFRLCTATPRSPASVTACRGRAASRHAGTSCRPSGRRGRASRTSTTGPQRSSSTGRAPSWSGATPSTTSPPRRTSCTWTRVQTTATPTRTLGRWAHRAASATAIRREWTAATSCAAGGVTTLTKRQSPRDATVNSTGVATSSVKHVEGWWIFTPASNLAAAAAPAPSPAAIYMDRRSPGQITQVIPGGPLWIA